MRMEKIKRLLASGFVVVSATAINLDLAPAFSDAHLRCSDDCQSFLGDKVHVRGLRSVRPKGGKERR